MPVTDVPDSLRRAMRGAEQAYQAADLKWFDYLDDEITVYAIQSTAPVIGREHFRRMFEEAFVSTPRELKVLDQDINVLDGTAVVAQTIQIEQSEVFFNLRQSVVWTQRGDDWKINHLHTAMIGEAHTIGVRTARTTDEIRVLNEKIATVSSVLGVAQ